MSRLTAVLLLCLMTATVAASTEVAGVRFEARVQGLEGAPLLLNGAGLRSRFFVKVYVAGLYLGAPATEAAAVLDLPGAKRIRMRFLRDVEARAITGAWREGFQANLDTQALSAVLDRLERFNALFVDIADGDEIVLDLDPVQGTVVRIAGVERGRIPGVDFQRALLAVWLGPEPADEGLKRDWLRGAAQ
jgi:hypothetical protein